MRMADAAATRARVTPAERLALLLASLCHDMHHPGVSNAYLVSARAPVAALYNDTSVLEHASAAGAYALASKLGSSSSAVAGGASSSSSGAAAASSAAASAAAAGDVFASLDPASWKEVRRLFIAAVLHTDMTYHFPMVSKVEVFYEMNAAAISKANAAEANAAAAAGSGVSFFAGGGGGGRGSSAVRAAAAAAAAVAAAAAAAAAANAAVSSSSKASCEGGGSATVAAAPGGNISNDNAASSTSPSPSSPSLLFPTAEERPFLIAILLHCADISNAAKPRPITVQWATRVLAEFFAQGDAERAAGLPVSPLCDRATTSLPGSLGNFIEFVVAPLFHQAARVFPGFAPLMGHVLDNRRAWHAELVRELETGTGPAASRTPEERASELAKAEARVESFERTYGSWGVIAEAAAAAAAAAAANAAAAAVSVAAAAATAAAASGRASGASSSDGSTRGVHGDASSSRRRSNSIQNVGSMLSGAFSRGRSRSGSGSSILSSVAEGNTGAGDKPSSSAQAQGGGSGLSRLLARGTIFGGSGGGGGGSKNGNSNSAAASSSAGSELSLRRMHSMSKGAAKNTDPLSSAERGGT